MCLTGRHGRRMRSLPQGPGTYLTHARKQEHDAKASALCRLASARASHQTLGTRMMSGSGADGPVDALSQEVSVAVVTAVLQQDMEHHHPQ